MVAAVLPLLPERFDPPTLWQTAFQSTYGAELRSEGPQRAVELYTHDRARYDAVTPHALRLAAAAAGRSEEHTSELQSLMRISYAVFCLKKKNHPSNQASTHP